MARYIVMEKNNAGYFRQVVLFGKYNYFTTRDGAIRMAKVCIRLTDTKSLYVAKVEKV